MERVTFDGNLCDIAQCRELPCPYNGACSQRKVWERLKAYEDTGLEPAMLVNYKTFEDEAISKGVTLSSTDEDTILDLVDACAENCKVYGGYVSSVEDVEEAKRALAKQTARCVERAMLDNDMFLVDGDTVRWKLLLYGGDSDADKEVD